MKILFSLLDILYQMNHKDNIAYRKIEYVNPPDVGTHTKGGSIPTRKNLNTWTVRIVCRDFSGRIQVAMDLYFVLRTKQ